MKCNTCNNYMECIGELFYNGKKVKEYECKKCRATEYYLLRKKIK